MPPGTTECNHSYYSGNSFSAPHFARQLQHGTLATPAQPPASILESDGPASSGAISSSLLTRSTITAHKSLRIPPEMAQVLSCRSLKRSRSSHSLSSCSAAESQLLLPSRLDHQCPSHFRMLLCRRLHLVTSLRRCPRRRLINRTRFRVMWQFRRLSMVPIPYPWMLPCRRPHPAPCLSMSLRRLVLAQCPRFSVDMSGQTPVRSAVPHDAATQLPLTEFLFGCTYSNSPLDSQNSVRQSPPPMQGSHALLQPPPGLEQPAPPPELAAYSHLLTAHGASANSSPSHAQQSPVSTTQVGTHPVRTATSAKRSASIALAGTHNPIGSDPCTGTGPFPKPWALVLPMVSFGQPKSDKLGTIATVDSDLMHHQFRLSLLQWNPGPARRNPTNIVSAACGKFHAVLLQEASDHVPHISDQFKAYTGNTDLAILLNKDTFEPDPMVLAFKEDSTSKKYVGYGSTHRSRPTATPFTFWYTDCHFLLGTHPQCCGQET